MTLIVTAQELVLSVVLIRHQQQVPQRWLNVEDAGFGKHGSFYGNIEELTIDKKTRRGGDASTTDGLIKFPVVFRALVPPTRIGGVIDGLLRHNFIDFEIRHLAMAKQRESLIYGVVEQVAAGEVGLDSEPPVRLLLELDVIEAVAVADTE